MSGFSTNQFACVQQIRSLMKRDGIDDPLRISRDELAQIHRRCYPQLTDADSKTVSAYVSSNLRSARFIALLGGDAPEVELRKILARLSTLAHEVRDIARVLELVLRNN